MSERRRHWLGVELVVGLWLLLSVASYYLLVLPRQNRFDFYHCWVGTRAVLARENPYSQEVVRRIHEGMFGEWHGGAEYIQQRFAYPEFGIWTVRTRKARNGRNPRTGAPIRIKASKTVSFRPAKSFKTKL